MLLLLLVFAIATVNLGVGYALGAGLTLSSLMERLPARKQKPLEDDIDEEPLTRPAASANAKAEPSEDATTNDAADDTPPPPKPQAKPKPADVIAGLASFREKLSTASVELKLNQEDPERFEASASKLQQVNHEYLEQAEGAIKHLGELGDSGDQVASATRDAVARGADRVGEISSKIDGLIESGLDDNDSRESLIKRSAEARELAVELEKTTEETVAAAEAAADQPPTEPEASPPADAVSFESIDKMFERLEEALAAIEGENALHVAAVRLDPIADHEEDQEVMDEVTEGIATLAGEVLGDTQSYILGRPSLVFLEGDQFEGASERIEKLRQQVEATTFNRTGEEIKATVTCAVADARPGASRDEIIDQLNQALEESGRLGFNRTFHHDGAFPTPVPELPVETVERSISLR